MTRIFTTLPLRTKQLRTFLSTFYVHSSNPTEISGAFYPFQVDKIRYRSITGIDIIVWSPRNWWLWTQRRTGDLLTSCWRPVGVQVWGIMRPHWLILHGNRVTGHLNSNITRSDNQPDYRMLLYFDGKNAICIVFGWNDPAFHLSASIRAQR